MTQTAYSMICVGSVQLVHLCDLLVSTPGVTRHSPVRRAGPPSGSVRAHCMVHAGLQPASASSRQPPVSVLTVHAHCNGCSPLTPPPLTTGSLAGTGLLSRVSGWLGGLALAVWRLGSPENRRRSRRAESAGDHPL